MAVTETNELEESGGEHGGLSPARFLISMVDGAIGKLARRPLKVRPRITPGGLLHGRLDGIRLELGGMEAQGLELDCLALSGSDARISVGLLPRLRVTDVEIEVSVLQAGMDRWARSINMPGRLRLTSAGLVATWEVRGRVVAETTLELKAKGSLVSLRPVRASVLKVSAPMPPGGRWYLPLPIPKDARLTRVEPESGRLRVYFSVPDIDERISPFLAKRLRKRLDPALLGRIGSAAVRATSFRPWGGNGNGGNGDADEPVPVSDADDE